ncbi:MAG: MFS transporter [Propionibacteriales bacterium]|nr:MFS transporter [Propionibacteriales bacterium]
MNERELGRDGVRLQTTAFVITFDRFAMPPLLFAISRDLAVPLAAVAGAAGAYFLAYGLMQPVWGLVSERVGFARAIRWAVLGGAVMTLASALATDVATLTLARVGAGLCFSAAFPSTLTYIGETVPVIRRQREVSRLMAGVALGTASSTMIAGAVADTVGWRWVFAGSGALAALTAWFVWSLSDVPRRPERRAAWVPVVRMFRNPRALMLLGLVAAEGAGLLGAFTFIPAAVESTGWGPAAAAAPAALFGLAILASVGVVGRLSTHVPASRFIAVGSVLGVLGCLLVSERQSPAVAAGTCLLLGLCWASMHTSLQTWATEVAPEERATVVAFFAGSLFAGSALTATVGGRLADDGRFALIFAGCAVLTGLVGVLGSLTRVRWERDRR